MTMRIETECLQSGQPRPYADSTYIYRIRCTYQTSKGEYVPSNRWSKKTIRPLAVVLFDFVEKSDPKYNWASKTITSITDEGSGIYTIRGVAAYTG